MIPHAAKHRRIILEYAAKLPKIRRRSSPRRIKIFESVVVVHNLFKYFDGKRVYVKITFTCKIGALLVDS